MCSAEAVCAWGSAVEQTRLLRAPCGSAEELGEPCAGRPSSGTVAFCPGVYRTAPEDDARRLLDWLREEELAAARPRGSVGVQGLMTIG
jgi:hypothetical protein